MDQMMLNQVNRELVVIDVETSGVNPFWHDILAIGIAPLYSELPTKLVYVRPDKITWGKYAKENFKKYKLEWDAAALAPINACEAVEKYLAELFPGQTVTPVGHNIGFDVAFLRKLAFMGGKEQLAGLAHRVIDTHTLLFFLSLQGVIPQEATSSDGAFKFFGIDIPDDIRHTALGDAIATREILKGILELVDRNYKIALLSGNMELDRKPDFENRVFDQI
jgi:DNA polymerase III epsilon subunit-like protein